MSLPHPNIVFTPLTTITAQDHNNQMANVASLADGTGVNDGAIVGDKLKKGTITADKIDFATFRFGPLVQKMSEHKMLNKDAEAIILTNDSLGGVLGMVSVADATGRFNIFVNTSDSNNAIGYLGSHGTTSVPLNPGESIIIKGGAAGTNSGWIRASYRQISY